MSIISGIGPSSGINYDQLISGILQIARQPIIRLQDKQSAYNEKISVYGTLSTKLSTLKSAVDKLRTSSNFYVKTAAVSDSTVLDATANNSATVGSYLIEPHSVAGKIQLASADRRTSTTTVASSTTVINSSGTNQTFEYAYAGTTRTLTVANNTTLEGLRDLINNDTGNPGVTASILQVGTNDYRLVLAGKDTGVSNNITITANTTLNGAGGTYNFTDAAFTASTAADAKFRVGGVDITRSTNTITDVITGVTIILKKETTGSVTLSVTNDTTSIRQNIEAFVNAYNDAVSYVSSNSSYDTTTRIGGPLFGESTPKNILNKLRGIITSRVTGLPEDLRALSQIGISTNSDGTLTLNTSTLDTKLSSNLQGVANIFTDSTSGIANQVYSYIDVITDPIDGAVTIRVNGLESVVGDISDDIMKLEEKLNRMEQNLRRQFASLESLLGGLTSQGAFLTNQINIWAKK